MKNLMLFLVITFCSTSASSQNPPPMDMPSEQNKILIDKVIVATGYEDFFKSYCLKKIETASKDSNWTDLYKHKITESVQFKYFNSTIYNVLANASNDELNEIINLYSKLNQNRSRNKLIITNGMITSNLEGFVSSVIQGKYIASK